MRTIIEELRARVMAWAKVATLEQLGGLSGEVLGVSVGQTSKSRLRRRKIPKRARFKMTREQSNMVREAMNGLEFDSPAYRKKQDELCREHGFCRRQVSSAVGGLERAAKRKKKIRKAKE